MNQPAIAQTKFVGRPDGPRIFVPEFGCHVGTFTREAGGRTPSLRWHVPLKFRGDFRPEDLANYDPQKTYKTDALGKVICYGFKVNGEPCIRRAVNRYSRCDIHGGRLHPLDKLVKEHDAKEVRREGLSRYKQYLAGTLSIDDLDDEELATGSFRSISGRLFKPKNLPRDLLDGFRRAIFDRAHQELLTHTVDAAKTLAEIMNNKKVDPEVRLKAANLLIERNLGKTPQVVALTNQAPWEEIFDGIAGGARESSRKRRIEIERLETDGGIIDAEISAGPGDDENDSATDDAGNGLGNEVDATSEPECDAEDSGDFEATERGDGNSDERDQRLFERNPAILAQEIERPPFVYDLTPKPRKDESSPPASDFEPKDSENQKSPEN